MVMALDGLSVSISISIGIGEMESFENGDAKRMTYKEEVEERQKELKVLIPSSWMIEVVVFRTSRATKYIPPPGTF